MQLSRRRTLAILLILFGLAALIFGAWILISLFWNPSDNKEPALPQVGTDLTVTPREVPEPQVYSAPTTIEGESTFTNNDRSSDLTEARNRASIVVSRMGSGSSKSGFLGFLDVLVDGTPRFQSYLRELQLQVQVEHPSDGPLYGVTTRVVSAEVADGANGDDEFIVDVQAQIAEDAGDKGSPTSVRYELFHVTLLRQSDDTLLVDRITSEPVNQ